MTFPIAVSLTQPINADVIHGSCPGRKQRKTKPGTMLPPGAASGIPRRVDSRVSADDGLSDGETCLYGAAEYAIAQDSVI